VGKTHCCQAQWATLGALGSVLSSYPHASTLLSTSLPAEDGSAAGGDASILPFSDLAWTSVLHRRHQMTGSGVQVSSVKQDLMMGFCICLQLQTHSDSFASIDLSCNLTAGVDQSVQLGCQEILHVLQIGQHSGAPNWGLGNCLYVTTELKRGTTAMDGQQRQCMWC
jgi:hypothetical protein